MTKDPAVQVRPDRDRATDAGRTMATQDGAAMAPPGYGIDFLDRRSGSEALPGTAPAATVASPGEPVARTPANARPSPRDSGPERLLAPAVSLAVPQRHGQRPALGSTGEAVVVPRAPAPAERQTAPGKPYVPVTEPAPQAGGAAAPLRWQGVAAAGRPTATVLDASRKFPFTVPNSGPVPGSTGPSDRAEVIPSGTARPVAEGRGAVDFLAVQKPEPEAALAVRIPARAEKPGFPPEAVPPASGKEAASPAAARAADVKTGRQVPPAPLLVTAAPSAPGARARSTTVEPPALAAQPAESGAATAAAPTPRAEVLADDTGQSPEQQATEDKLDAASLGMEPEESADAAGPGPEAQGPHEAAAELPPPDSGGGGEMAAAPTPLVDDSATAAAAASQQTARMERIEQSDREQAAEERADEQDEERAEARPEAAQAEASLASGAESAELTPQEKAAGLAAVGEDAGGGQAAPGGGGGGGGGGGDAPTPEPEAPDTAAMEPEAGLALAAGLPFGAAAKALGGVGSAVDQSIQQEVERLQGELPEVEVGGEGGGTAVQPLTVVGGAGKVPRAPPAGARPTPTPKPLPELPPSPVRNIPAPRLTPAADGALSAADAQRVQTSIQSLPTTDPGLDVVAGPPPTLSLSGDADPAQIADQERKLRASIADQRAQGAAEVATPAGENDIRVRRPKESLKSRALAVPAAGAAGAVESPDEAIGIIAEAKQGGEVRAAISQAQGEIAAKRAAHHRRVAEEKDKARQQLDEMQVQNAGQQHEARQQARAGVAKARADWTEEQRQEVANADEKTQAELVRSDEKIAREQQQADSQASSHMADGERQAVRHKRDAESQVEARKKDAEGESQGVFGWVASKAPAFFDKLKQGLTAIFDAAKRLVRAAIEQAKKLALAVIEKARAAVVAIIRAVGDALIAIGDVLLAAFPKLRAKWRAFIESKVKAAEDLVHKLADALKRGVHKLLDLLGKGLEFLLDAYRKAMLMALDAAKAAAMGAIKFARSVANTLGAFVALVKDIARNPGAWIANLGAAVKDGIRNHVWKAFSSAVKNWFNDKIDEVVGIGTAIWGVLKKGGIAFKEIAGMVWQGLKQAIPAALVGLLIEKLVAMIVPAAGAVMVVIEGIKAAWGSVQRIIAAVGKFVEFLKAVKGGGAGPQFAAMLAAAAVVVIDFVANWLLRRLRGPASKVGGKIKAIAQRIMLKVKALAKRAGGWVKDKFKGLTKKLKGWKRRFSNWREKRKGKKGKSDSDKKKDKEQAKQKKLDAALEAIRPEIAKVLSKGTSRFIFTAKLLYLRLRHRLTSLKIEGGRVVARLNPTGEAGTAKPPGSEAEGIAQAMIPVLLEVLDEYDKEVLGKGEAKAQVEATTQQILYPGKGLVSLDQVPDDVRQAALRAASKKARESGDLGLFGAIAGGESERVQLGEEVTVKVGHPHFLSRVEIEALGGPYRKIAEFTEKGRVDFGLSHPQVIGAMSASHPEDLSKKIADLDLENKPGATAKKAAFARRMRRMSILNSLEAARLPDAAVAMQIAADLGATPGHAKPESDPAKVSDLIGPEGSKAPQTPVGAASQPSHPQHETGTATKRQRIGEIVRWLVSAIRADLIINDGFAVGPLIDAMGRFLKNQRGANVKKLKAQLMGFLKSRHGR